MLAFCMTALGSPDDDLPAGLRQEHLPSGARHVHRCSFRSPGVGSIVGALTVAALGNVSHKGRIALIMLTCLGAAISGFALSTSVWLSCLMLFLSGASLIAVFTLVNSLVQLITTNEMRGRVMSVYNFAFRGGMPMGNLLTGWLVPLFTAPLVLAVNGLVLMAVALYFLVVQRRVAAL